jgi:signal transduction histidine kinase
MGTARCLRWIVCGVALMGVAMPRSADAIPVFARIYDKPCGTGITPDNMARVFTPFFTAKASGTGFGLAVAKKIVERHGGTIAVESEVGRGTGFTIELPLLTPPVGEID